MALIISHPFRLAGGSVATVDEVTERASAEQLAVLVLTKRGERVLVPLFGVIDPAFSSEGIELADVSIAAQTFGPEVTLTDLSTRFLNDTTQEAVLSYE